MLKKFFVMLACLSAFPAFAVVTIGEKAPDIMAVDTNGKAFSLADQKGKIVVLEWTNHLCPFVKKHYDKGHMQSTQKVLTDKGIVWVSINSSAEGKQGYVSAEEANKIAAEKKATPSHIILDPKGDIGRAYGAKTTPHMFVIGVDGNLAYMGAIDDKATADSADIEGATNYVVAAVDALAAGKAVAVTTSQAYGCSVKY